MVTAALVGNCRTKVNADAAENDIYEVHGVNSRPKTVYVTCDEAVATARNDVEEVHLAHHHGHPSLDHANGRHHRIHRVLFHVLCPSHDRDRRGRHPGCHPI